MCVVAHFAGAHILRCIMIVFMFIRTCISLFFSSAHRGEYRPVKPVNMPTNTVTWGEKNVEVKTLMKSKIGGYHTRQADATEGFAGERNAKTKKDKRKTRCFKIKLILRKATKGLEETGSNMATIGAMNVRMLGATKS